MAMQAKKVFKTDDQTILIVTASTKGTAGRKYVSVTADEISPLSYKDAEERNREYLEDGELWKMAVEAGRTTDGLDKWVDYVIAVDGPISLIDNSLYPRQITIDNDEYIFESGSCGCLHDEIKEVTRLFDRLIELHLSDNEACIIEAERIIKSIPNEDIGHEVERYARQILGID